MVMIGRQGRLEVQWSGWEVRVGGGTAELVHSGDGPQVVPERTGPVQGEGWQARMQRSTGNW